MPAPELSEPPSKRRKTTKTYGSSNFLARAFQAVQDVVPGNLLSLNKKAHDHSTNTIDSGSNSTSPISSHSVQDLAAQSQPSMSAHATNPVWALDNNTNMNQEPSSADRRNLRASRRHQGNEITVDTDKSPPRKKRRKSHNGAGTAQESSSQHSDKDANAITVQEDEAAAATSGRKLPAIAPPQDEIATTIDKAPNSDIKHQSSGLRSSRKSRRTAGPSSLLDANIPSPVASASNVGMPQTPVSTPGRKRGRPRKYPVKTPIVPPEEEENQLGFHKINADGVTAVEKRVSKTPGSGRQLRNDREQAALMRTRARTQGHQQDTKPIAKQTHVDDPAPFETQREEESSWPDEEQELQKASKKVETAIHELQQMLEVASPASLHDLKFDILAALTGRRASLSNMEEEYHKVRQLVAQSVLAGEGNSLLVIGPRGCGKTTLLESILADLEPEHGDSFIVVRLNGFIHTDDKLALREIWRQLGREVAGEDDTTSSRTNYADALTSLLALLAHSPEDESKEEEIARSVIFVIDEFDLFASHPRQTLLYNLFDVAQSRNAPIAVLGLTTRIDIVESLEKRVKSRFGQRYVYLTHPRTFQAFQHICKATLIARDDPTKSFDDRLRGEKLQDTQLRAKWNHYVDMLFAEDGELRCLLEQLFARSKCITSFSAAAMLPISVLSPSNIPTGLTFLESWLPSAESKLQLLPSLSDLELSLLIAGARLDIILDTDVCNFAMVYEEYVQLASRIKVQSSAAGQTAVGGGARVWGKEVSLRAWEKLTELELVIPAGTGARASGGAGAMWRVDVAIGEIGPSVPRMRATLAKWCREI
ncbi:MAG: hypothetical protein LQ350_005280 [Teloschistes chrysophthalmus]|nr:MAG: hypothetical protein LQ350_005280 [Niorma chrysophthalma]